MTRGSAAAPPLMTVGVAPSSAYRANVIARALALGGRRPPRAGASHAGAPRAGPRQDHDVLPVAIRAAFLPLAGVRVIDDLSGHVEVDVAVAPSESTHLVNVGLG